MRLFILLFICLFICESSFSARDYKVFFYRIQSVHTPEKPFYMALLAFVAQSKNKNGSVEPIKKTTYRLLKLTDAFPEAKKFENHPYHEVLLLAQLFADDQQKQKIIHIFRDKSCKSSTDKIEAIQGLFREKSIRKEIKLSFNVDDGNCSRLYQAYGELIFEDNVKYGIEEYMIKSEVVGLLKPINRYLEISEDEYNQSYCQILGNKIYEPSSKLSHVVMENIRKEKQMRCTQETQNESPDVLKFSPVADPDEKRETLRLFQIKAKNALGLNVTFAAEPDKCCETKY
jgi:hypothetical protein